MFNSEHPRYFLVAIEGQPVGGCVKIASLPRQASLSIVGKNVSTVSGLSIPTSTDECVEPKSYAIAQDPGARSDAVAAMGAWRQVRVCGGYFDQGERIVLSQEEETACQGN